MSRRGMPIQIVITDPNSSLAPDFGDEASLVLKTAHVQPSSEPQDQKHDDDQDDDSANAGSAVPTIAVVPAT
jgi:hypothetical protein